MCKYTKNAKNIITVVTCEKELPRVSFGNMYGHIYFMEDNLFHAMSKLQYVYSVVHCFQLKFFIHSLLHTCST